MKKWIIITLLLLLACTSDIQSHETREIEPVDAFLFSPVVLPLPPSSVPPPSPAETAQSTSMPIATRDTPKQPKSKPKSESKETPKTQTRQVTFDGGILKGKATWMCNGNGNGNCHYKYPDTSKQDYYAAAGPALRAMLGSDWRGQTVKVMKGGNSVLIKLIDWCQCHKDEDDERIIDIYADGFEQLAALSRGKVTVRIQER